MGFEYIAIMVVFLPLLGSIITGALLPLLSLKQSAIITCFGVSLAAILSWWLAFELTTEHITVHTKLFAWFDIPGAQTYWSVYVDQLTTVMFVVVTTISALVHFYSIGYMEHDPHPQRFFTYLSLFTFCMLMLVSADNFLQLFFGWEGVGLSSYLLIGFWYKKSSANQAAIKAFLVNRVGDIGLILGIFLIFIIFGTFDYQTIFMNLETLPYTAGINFLGGRVNAITLICILLFMGCMGKSAQLGLHTWLPDAMEGPTPVSALIHAATMVTAGVFLLARCSPLFELSPIALDLVICVGALTSVFAASIAIVQDDIKKIIAYSTCSQLGYMFFACGVSAYSSAIFHLSTHAFFKALLFLGAGSVIHAMHDEQNIKRMGGLWNKIPVTYTMMLIGSLALAAVFPFAGFYSKDAILHHAYASGSDLGHFAYWCGVIGAGMTSFYSWRLLILVFHGKRTDSAERAHESPFVMLLPLAVLACGAMLSGFLGEGLFLENTKFWGDALVTGHTGHDVPSWAVMMPTTVAILSILLAYLLYYFGLGKVPRCMMNKLPIIHNILKHKWYFDEIYHYLIVRNVQKLAHILWRRLDSIVIDGMPNGMAGLTSRGSRMFSRLQSGYVYHYAMTMLVALLAFLSWVIFAFK